jgi:4,5-dihydroxyphthalate decarboxylase
MSVTSERQLPETLALAANERVPPVIESGGDARVHLTMAATDYDHLRDLVHGVVRPDGITLTAFTLEVEEIFYRFLKYLEWDISEVSLAKFLALSAQGQAPFVGIPVFPSRVFRHSAIYVRKDRNITTAKALEGKTVGIPEWAQTAGIFARGLLAETYNVDLAKILWIQAGVDQPGRVEKVDIKLPKGINYVQRPDKSLSELLLDGDIDAVVSARAPRGYASGEGPIVRLFEDYRSAEARYYEQTKIFPIMHVIAIRRAVYERYPWVAKNLLTAFDQAKARSLARLADITVSRIALPWGAALASEFASLFGRDPYPYGIEANRTTLEAFCRFAQAQGLTQHLVHPDELFPPEVRGPGHRV